MFSRPTLSALRQQAVTDVQSANLTNDNAVLMPQSILRTLAVTEAGLAYELYSYLDYIAKMAIPVTAEGEFLESWANLRAVYRLAASTATGTTTFTGTPGVSVPSGTLLSTPSNVQYATVGSYQIGLSPPVGIVAAVPGSAGNALAGIALGIVSPLAGVTSNTVAASPLSGGADQEDDASFRNRMLAVYAAPPAGGNANDYVNWALQVPGCTRAWVQNQALGVGSVGVFVMFDNEVASNGFPSGVGGVSQYETRYRTKATLDLLTVADHIYPLRPITSLVGVYKPTPAPIAFTLQALSPSTAAMQGGIAAALADLFVRLGNPLAGNAIYLSDVNAAIESVAGIGRFNLVSPSTTITVPVGSLPVVGVITYTA